ncbi:MAG TPA: ADOP family duplicated permease [Gemmatimonadaceae bacterium]|nr:ADOP family duplicated permease [Gemmatimonadaceae bacterium]
MTARRWFRLLLHLYPADFREEMGDALISTYEERLRAARSAGALSVLGVYMSAFADSVYNGLGERLHPAVSWRRAGNWGRDTELVVRRLVRAPVFTMAMLGTLTVGLGAFGVVYTVVHDVLLAPLPYERPGDLYTVWRDYRAFFDLDRGWLAGTDVAALQEGGGPIESVAGMQMGRAIMTDASGGHPSEISVMISSANLFDMLGVHPMLGRGFAPEDEGDGQGTVIVLGYAMWNRLGGDSAIIGRDILLDGQPLTVIGVMPRGFGFAGHGMLGLATQEEAYVPFSFRLASTKPNQGTYGGLLRARPGTPEDVVKTAVSTVGQLVNKRDFGGRGMKLYAVPFQPDLVAKVRPALMIVGIAGGFLVLVLLLNLASVLLVRSVQREKELAVSRALGADGVALMRATLLEGGALGLLGGAAGALVAIWATKAFVAMAPVDLPRREYIGVTWPVALTIVAVGVALGLLAALAPAIWAARARLASLLTAASVRGGGGQGRARRALVVVQVALSLVLLTAGGLVVRSFGQLLRADPGFNSKGVLTLRIPITNVSARPEAYAKQEALQRELAGIPGVSVVGAASALPFGASADQGAFVAPGAPGNSGDFNTDRLLVDYIQTRPGFIEAMGMRVLDGHTFEPQRPPGPREAVIDQLLAQKYYPGRSAVGRVMLLNGDTLQVIGVVQHARLYDVHEDGRQQVYVRNEGNFGYASLTYAIRTTGDPMRLAGQVRAAVAHVDPQLAVADMKPMTEVVQASLSQQRTSAVLIAGFSLGALLLAAMGLFGVVSGTVTRRRNELAVRLALGADHARVLRLVVGEGAALIALGLLIGAPGVYATGRIVRSILVGVSPWDPFTLGAVAFGLAGVALLACWLPARGVLRIEPALVLREE